MGEGAFYSFSYYLWYFKGFCPDQITAKENNNLIRAEVEEMHGTCQVTTCARLGFPRLAMADTPGAETIESFP